MTDMNIIILRCICFHYLTLTLYKEEQMNYLHWVYLPFMVSIFL